MSRRAWLLMGLLAATWGASYLFIKLGLRDFSAGFIVCARTALGALVLICIAVRRRALGALRGRLGPLALIAVIQVAAPFLLITFGERHISSSLAGILVSSAPIFTALLAFRFDDEERSRGTALLGVLVGIVGVALLFGVDLSGRTAALVGGLMVLGAGFGYAAGAMLLKHKMNSAPPVPAPVAVAAGTMSISAVLTLPLALATFPTSIGWDSGLGVLALGALGTGLAFLLFYTLIADVGPARASIVAYIAPGFALAYGALFLSEHVGLTSIAGLALILAGSWLGVGGRLPRAHRTPART